MQLSVKIEGWMGRVICEKRKGDAMAHP